MANLNKVFLMGNLTRDVETKYTPNQTAVVNFGLATNRKWADQSGQQREETCFVECEAWSRTAEVIAKYAGTKGSLLFVEGRLKLDQWQNDQGQSRSKLKVTVEHVQLLPQSQGQPQPQGQSYPPQQDTSDIPF